MTRLAALLPLALVACVDSGDEGMYIVKNVAVSGSCAPSADPGQAGVVHGSVSVEAADAFLGYVLTPLIQSRLAPLEGDTDDISRTVQFRRADVTARLVAVNSAGSTTQLDLDLGAHSAYFAGALPPGGYASTVFELLTSAQIKQIGDMYGATAFRAEVLASAKVVGVINDDAVESSEYVFPVTVHNENIRVDRGVCPITPSGATNPCNPYQDGVIECCTNMDGSGTTCFFPL